MNPYKPPELTPPSRRRAYEALVGYLKECRMLESKHPESVHSQLDESQAILIDNVFS